MDPSSEAMEGTLLSLSLEHRQLSDLWEVGRAEHIAQMEQSRVYLQLLESLQFQLNFFINLSNVYFFN